MNMETGIQGLEINDTEIHSKTLQRHSDTIRKLFKSGANTKQVKDS